MATSFTITMGTVNAAFTLDDADAARILAAYTEIFTEPAVDENGVPVLDGNGDPTYTVPTAAEVVNRLANDVVVSLGNQTRRHEQNKAAESARESVAEINPPTPV